MGNSAIIKFENRNLGVYLHWNGGYDSVLAFTKYCKLKEYRTDDYGIARLIQVIGNFFGGALSLGACSMKKRMNSELVEKYGLDNGVYELDNNWEIVKHWNPDLVTKEYHEGYDLIEFLCLIDGSMPLKEQLGKDFITAEEVPTSELKVGDKVYIKRYEEGNPEIHTVVGIAGEDEWCNGNVSNLPYIDLYERDGDYSWNGNNYIRTETVRCVKTNQKEED